MNRTLIFVFLTVITVTLCNFQNSYVTSFYEEQFSLIFNFMETTSEDFFLFGNGNNSIIIGQYDKISGTLLNEVELNCSSLIVTTLVVNDTFFIAVGNATYLGNTTITDIPYSQYTLIAGYTFDNGSLVETFWQIYPVTIGAMTPTTDGTLILGGNSDLFMAIYKVDMINGSIVWSRSYPGNGVRVLDIVIDQANGDIYATGLTQVGLNGKPPVGEGNDMWIMKLDSQADTNTTTVIGSTGFLDSVDSLLLANGSLFFVGSVDGSQLVQDGVPKVNLSHPGNTEILIVKMNKTTLQVQAAKSIGTESYDFASSSAVDVDGNILVFSINGGPFPGIEGNGSCNVAKFRENLDLVYLYQLSGELVNAYNIASEPNTNIYFLFGGADNSQTGLLALTDQCMATAYCNFTGTTGESTTGTTDPGTTTTTSQESFPQSQDNNNNNTIIIASTVSVAALLIGISALSAFLILRRKRLTEVAKEEELGPPTATLYKDLPSKNSINNSFNKSSKSVEVIDVDDIAIENRLGGGYFGEVYKGLWHGTTPVALKRLKDTSMLTEFLQEADVLQSLSMPYIVRFFGIWTDKEGCKYIVTEFMAKGSMKEFLDQHEKILKVTDLILMAKDIAAGMKFMASKDFIHRDLAARNILVKEEEGRFVAKVADFGLARLTQSNYYTKGGAIPIRWSAPEVLTKEKFSCKSDVWAYAVVLWEMFEFGKLPYVGKSNEEVCQMVLAGQRLSQPEQCPAEVWAIMQKCWNSDPQARPNFEEIYGMITDVAKNFGIYSSSQPQAPINEKSYAKLTEKQTYQSPSDDDESVNNYNAV